MPYRDENDLMEDAPANTGTQLGFVPPDGPFDGESEANTVVGTLTNKHDKDWISIELNEWTLYTITVGGSEMLTNTTLGLFDSAGNPIVLKDDDYSDGGNLHVSYRPSLNVLIGDGFALSYLPTLFFTPSPEQGNGTQKYFIQVGAYADEEVNDYIQVGQYTGYEDNDLSAPAEYTVTVYETMSIDGSPGNDQLEGRLVRGFGGNDMITARVGGTGGLLFGGEGNDTVEGGDYFDYLQGGSGADKLVGGGGYDIASYAGSTGGITVRLHSRQAKGGDAAGDTFPVSDIYTYSIKGGEEIEVSFPDVENLQGSAGADTLAGDFRNNHIWGGDGDDKIYGGPGLAEPNYVDGLDLVVHKSSGQRYWSFNQDSLYGEGGNDKIYGGPGNDKLYGGPGSDELYAGSGRDELYGGHGNDTLVAGDTVLTGRHPANYRDVDCLYGGPGADRLVGNGGDVAYYDSSPAGVTVRLHSGQAAGGDAEGDTFAGTGTYTYLTRDDYVNQTEDDRNINTFGGRYLNNPDLIIRISFPGTESLVGSPYDDVLAGDLRNNGISGGDGDDVIYGGPTPAEYNDFVRVTLGEVDPESGKQLILAETAARGISAILAPLNGDSLYGEGGNDKLYGGPGDDWLNGGDGNDELRGGIDFDTLRGGEGDDSLYGGPGGDALYGGPGNDDLYGGDGSDEFFFNISEFGQDRIYDYEDGSERLDFKGSGLTYSDLSIVSDGGSTVIEVTETGNSVTLVGIDASLIGQDDFIF